LRGGGLVPARLASLPHAASVVQFVLFAPP
jgi:hypothetical protein